MRQKNVTGGNSRSSARSGSENAKDLYPPAGQRQPTLDFFPLKRSGGADDLCHSSPHGSFTQSRATEDSFPAFANRQLIMPFFRADTFGKMYSPSLNTLVSTLTPATTYRRYLHPQLALLPFCPQSALLPWPVISFVVTGQAPASDPLAPSPQADGGGGRLFTQPPGRCNGATPSS